MKLRVQTLNFDNNRSVKFERIKRKYHYNMHIHEFAELVFPIEGEISLFADGREEILKPGMAAFIFPFQPHGYSSKQYNDIAISVFSPAIAPDFFKNTDGRRGLKSTFTPEKHTLKVFETKIFNSCDFELFEIKGAIYLALGDYISQTELSSDSKNYDIASSIINYIKDHLTDDINIKNLSEHLGYSRSFVSGRIKKIFGINLSSIVSAARLEKAINLLCLTKNTSIEIANMCGFGSQQSFNRRFKELVGQTPSEYRKRAKISNQEDIIIKYF